MRPGIHGAESPGNPEHVDAVPYNLAEGVRCYPWHVVLGCSGTAAFRSLQTRVCSCIIIARAITDSRDDRRRIPPETSTYRPRPPTTYPASALSDFIRRLVRRFFAHVLQSELSRLKHSHSASNLPMPYAKALAGSNASAYMELPLQYYLFACLLRLEQC